MQAVGSGWGGGGGSRDDVDVRTRKEKGKAADGGGGGRMQGREPTKRVLTLELAVGAHVVRDGRWGKTREGRGRGRK